VPLTTLAQGLLAAGLGVPHELEPTEEP
jgi:hypothetical protein